MFDDYAAWAAHLFSTLIVLISLVDADLVWFKALVGAAGIPGLVRNESMCSATILQNTAVVVSDYKLESRKLIRPDVAQALGLNFYAGATLIAADGSRLGMLATIGKEARPSSVVEQAVRARLAGLVSQTIELRYRNLTADELGEWDDTQRDLTHALDDNPALARYLTARNQRIDFDDEAMVQPVVRQLEGVVWILARRLA